ncbi:6-phosphogluconolactonase [Pustulibacterium marinum]|uniref:6-phosphogluconolactonase n=1 Tax=Pustulibacterium marinum TaxID=1224947 RepID=A0A1I7IHP3_9FLAO|nr:lactonase family protein [Pustulibacterium marinum]SFU72458.1 6-phosphogluconolactonase [Pustulibacterium marinum]
MKKIALVLFSMSAIAFTSCKEEKKKTINQEQSITETKNHIENPVYVGTYTKKEGHVDGKADGIYLMDKQSDGKLKMIATVAELTNPSWVTISHDTKYLYAVSELVDVEGNSGYLGVYEINDDYTLHEVAQIPSGAYAPCHIAVDKTDKYVFVANYAGGVFMEFKKGMNNSFKNINKVNLNELPEAVTKTSHAHEITFSDDNKHFYVNDLGDDKIWIYDFDESNGDIKPNQQPYVSTVKGAGPRHFVIADNQKFAYSINELNSTVTVFSFDKNTGGLKKLQAITTLPEDYKEFNATAEIAIHPNGKYLYASNRGHNSIAAFKIDAEKGTLSSIGYQSTEGDFPRYFGIANQGKTIYAANQNTGNIAELVIHEDGTLSSANNVVEVPTPVCMAFIK